MFSERSDPNKPGSSNFGVFVINADGSGRKVLAQTPAFEGSPSLSLDGLKVVFESNRDIHRQDGLSQIYIMNSDGTGRRKLTPATGGSYRPSVNRDGRKIAFVSDRTGRAEIYVMNSYGTGLKQLTTAGGNVPALSADGDKLLFVVGSEGQFATGDICMMNSDGAAFKKWGSGAAASFSPDGRRIASVRGGDLYIANADGTGEHLVFSPLTEGAFSFSPDGEMIAFTSDPALLTPRSRILSDKTQSQRTELNNQIFLINCDGTGLRQLTAGLGDCLRPSWGRTPGVPYVAPPQPAPTPIPQCVAVTTQHIPGDPLVSFSSTLALGSLVYTFNDLDTASYPSYLLTYHWAAAPAGSRQAFRLQGLQGTQGDLAFDPQWLPDGVHALVKLGDPIIRLNDRNNFYHLWLWNRRTNEFRLGPARKLFFPIVSPSPDGQKIAYVAGGNALGETPDEAPNIAEPLSLRIFDLQTGQDTLVASNSAVRGGFAWLNAETLLYTVLPQSHIEAVVDRKPGAEATTVSKLRPDIHAFDLKAGRSRLLIHDGQHPSVAPDGEHIAFFGLRQDLPQKETLPLDNDWWQAPGPASLSVVRRDGTERKSFGVFGASYPSLAWRRDSKRLLILWQTQDAPHPRAKIVEWDIAKQGVRSVGTLRGKDGEAVEQSWTKPQFRALSVSPDDQTLLVAVEEAVNKVQLQATQSLQTVNLGSGAVSTLARLQGAHGFDWRPDA